MRVKVLLLSLPVLTLLNVVASAADMFSGTWKENISKSTYQSGPAPKQPTVQKIDASSGLKVERDSVDDQGQKIHTGYNLQFDGKDYPFNVTVGGKPVPGPATISAKRVDDSTIEFTFKANGIVTKGKWVVSRDGKTLAWTQTQVEGQPANNRYIY